MLSQQELELIKEYIGREPTYEEVLIFDALWSEHASYKSSKIHLKKLPTSADYVLAGPGENAGVIRLSDGTRVAFKIESHNHPSYIEPYSGAATGVGGIIRDILCLGARPIALADFICFGELKSPKMKYLFERVVEGISDYGNSVGVPVVRGQTLFYKFFEHNILVNVACIGVIPDDSEIISSFPKRKGAIIYVGAKTGRDGIGGASMASKSFRASKGRDETSAVQIGDPFAEKCLIEAVLETASKVQLIAMQDMGAAGFLNSTTEVASKGKFGAKIDVSKVPKRQPLEPIEVLLSESQERMLIVADPQDFQKIKQIFERWGLECEIVGELTDTGKYEVFDGEKLIFSLPLDILIDKAPVYDRTQKKPDWINSIQEIKFEKFPFPSDPAEVFIKVISSPLFSSKRFVFEQYDWGVLGQTCSAPGYDSAVIKLHSFKKFDEYGEEKNIALAFSIDGNPLYCFSDPYIGTQLTILESFRNLTCVGAKPLAITNNLNLGNPENPEVMWELVNVIEGMAKVLQDMKIPVVSGNVSLYNETEGVSIPPTPVIGAVGEIFPFSEPIKPYFDPGCFVIALGEIFPQIASSLYLYLSFGNFGGKLQVPNIELEKRVSDFIQRMARKGIINSCHDVSDGGIVPAVFESAVFGIYQGKDVVGVKLKKVFIKDESRWDFFIFSECYPLYIISVKRDRLEEFISECAKSKIPYQVIGETVDEDIFEVEGLFSLKISELRNMWEGALAKEVL